MRVCNHLSWIIAIILSIILLLFVHYFLQEYLFMKPCANCIYVRFALCLFILAAFIMMFDIKIAKSIAFAILILSLYIGFKYSYILNENYKAIKESNPFGIGFCPSGVVFFNIPLEKIFPTFFYPSGTCGLDKPIVDKNISDNVFREFFIGKKEDNFTSGLYSKGWFLLPKYEFINMAQGAFLVFLTIFILSLKEFIGFIKNKIYAFLSLILGFVLIYLSTL